MKKIKQKKIETGKQKRYKIEKIENNKRYGIKIFAIK